MEKKKVLKIIASLVVALILIWCSMLATDIICPIYFNKKPIFASVDTNTILKDGGSALYKGMAYSIQTKINLSVTDDDLFNVHYIKVKIFNKFYITIYRQYKH